MQMTDWSVLTDYGRAPQLEWLSLFHLPPRVSNHRCEPGLNSDIVALKWHNDPDLPPASVGTVGSVEAIEHF